MDRREIKQHVLDTLGIILVDKDPIRDNALLIELFLDETDMADFFSRLQADFGIVIAGKTKSDLSHLPGRDLTLERLVDLIQQGMKSKKHQ